MSIKFQLRIFIRPSFPQKREMLLEGDITNLDIPMDKLVELAFNIEHALNTNLPQIRVHSAINVENDNANASNSPTASSNRS